MSLDKAIKHGVNMEFARNIGETRIQGGGCGRCDLRTEKH